MLPMQILSVLILLSISEFCENLLKEDNSNNTFSDVMSQLFGSILRRKITKNLWNNRQKRLKCH